MDLVKTSLVCNICSKTIDENTIVYCPYCGKPYHNHCWKKAGYGCKKYKCKGSTLLRWNKLEIIIAKTINRGKRIPVKCINQNCIEAQIETSPFYIYCTKCGKKLDSIQWQENVNAYPFFEFVARHIMVFLVFLLIIFWVLLTSFRIVNNINQRPTLETQQSIIAYQPQINKTQKTLTPTYTIEPTDTSTPTFTPQPTPTRIPFMPYQPIKDCAKARVMIGDTVMVEDGLTNLFMRSSSDNHPSDNIIDRFWEGQKAVVISGPECSWGWMMWKIKRVNDGLEGWVAESKGKEFWLKLAN